MKRFFTKHPKLMVAIVSMLTVVGLVGVMASPTLAATTAVVTVTGTPAYISISIAPTTYTINSDTGGNSGMNISTTYYSNPLGGTTSPSATVAATTTECDFTITNTSSIVIDLTGNMANGSGGSNPMTNVNGATPGAASYAAYAYHAGETFANKVLLQSSGSALGNFSGDSGGVGAGVAANTTWYVGFQFSTQTGAWTGGTGSTYTLTITGTVH